MITTKGTMPKTGSFRTAKNDPGEVTSEYRALQGDPAAEEKILRHNHLAAMAGGRDGVEATPALTGRKL